MPNGYDDDDNDVMSYDDLRDILPQRRKRKQSLGELLGGVVRAASYGMQGQPIPSAEYSQMIQPGEGDGNYDDFIAKELLRSRLRSQAKREEISQQQEMLKNLFPTDEGRYTLRPKSFKIGDVTYEVPKTLEEIKREEERKPLSAEAANKYSGSIQGIKSIERISQKLRPLDESRMRNLIYKANLYISSTKAKDTLIPLARGAYQKVQEFRAGDPGASLGKEFLTLAENLLRARSGAAVTDSEMIREEARTLLGSFFESPATWQEKLMINRDFLAGTASGIRPLREKEWSIKIPAIHQPQQQYQVGQTIKKGNKNYIIVGFDTDGEPLVE